MIKVKLFNKQRSFVGFSKDYGIIFVIIKYFGIINFERHKTYHLILTLIVPALLHLHFVDHVIVTLRYVNAHWFKWKLELAMIISFAVRILAWHTLKRKSENVKNTMKKN